MSKREFTQEQKRDLALAWHEARSRGVKTQEAFALEHGVSARRVREFAAAYGPPPAPVAAMKKVLVDVMAALQRALEQLDLIERGSIAAEAARRAAPTTNSLPNQNAVTGDGTVDGPVAEEDDIGERKRFNWDLDS